MSEATKTERMVIDVLIESLKQHDDITMEALNELLGGAFGCSWINTEMYIRIPVCSSGSLVPFTICRYVEYAGKDEEKIYHGDPRITELLELLASYFKKV